MARRKKPEEEKIVYKPMPINLPEQLFIDFNAKIGKGTFDRTKLLRRWCENWTYRDDPNKDPEWPVK